MNKDETLILQSRPLEAFIELDDDGYGDVEYIQESSADSQYVLDG